MKTDSINLQNIINSIETKEININELKLNPKNPRFIKKPDFEKLKKSMKDFPDMLKYRPILVNDKNIILAGNMRYRAALDLGWDKVWYTNVEGLTAKQIKELIIKDNIGFGDWDIDMLANEWDMDDLKDWGLDLDFKTEPEAVEDNYEEPENIKVDVVFGDLIEIGEHRLLCGDSTDADQVEKLMNGEKADLAHNDPPYGMKKEKDGVINDNLNFNDLLEFNKDWIPLQFLHLKDNGSWYCWGIDEPLMDIYSNIIKPYQQENKLTFRNLITWDKTSGQGQNSEATRSYATADEKCLFIMMGKQNMTQNKDQFPEEWRPLLNYFKEEKDKMGWSIKDVINITGKTSASHYFTESQFQIPSIEHYKKIQKEANGKAFNRPLDSINKINYTKTSSGESILSEFYQNRAYFNNTHDNMNNVWHFNRTSQKERIGTGDHATPKPLILCSRVIKSSCADGGLVIDMFLGSGSTMLAAHQLKRKCYGMELDPKYCQVIINRMLNFDSSLEVKINGKKYKSA